MTADEKKVEYEKLGARIMDLKTNGPKDLIRSLKKNHDSNLSVVIFNNREFWRFVKLEDLLELIKKADEENEREIKKLEKEQLELFK